ncbi:hypothetical protein Xph01_01510 [Micromonospora phaseoli]|nr:hypothetical protein Xph01_01510 [Micromonospora phaseoli]
MAREAEPRPPITQEQVETWVQMLRGQTLSKADRRSCERAIAIAFFVLQDPDLQRLYQEPREMQDAARIVATADRIAERYHNEAERQYGSPNWRLHPQGEVDDRLPGDQSRTSQLPPPPPPPERSFVHTTHPPSPNRHHPSPETPFATSAPPVTPATPEPAEREYSAEELDRMLPRQRDSLVRPNPELDRVSAANSRAFRAAMMRSVNIPGHVPGARMDPGLTGGQARRSGKRAK